MQDLQTLNPISQAHTIKPQVMRATNGVRSTALATVMPRAAE
jgi:hypothetical protein